jgi:hypothetical protein
MSPGISMPKRLVHGLCLEHHGPAQISKRRFGDDAIERCAGQCADGVEADVAPELEPDIPAHILAHRRLEARTDERLAQRLCTRRAAAIRFAEDESLQGVVNDDARLSHLAGGLDHAADGTLGPYGVPLPVADIHGSDTASIEAAAALVEVPPRDAVHRGHHGGGSSKERREVRRTGVCLMRFQRANHEILMTVLPGIVARRYARHSLPAVYPEYEPALANGL